MRGMSEWNMSTVGKYLLILAVGLIFSAYMFYSINEKYILRNDAAIEAALIKVELKLTRELEKINLALETIKVFMENAPRLNRDLYEEISDPFLDELYGIITIQYAPALKTIDKGPEYPELNGGGSISTALNVSSNSSNSTGNEDRCYPVLFVSPASHASNLIGQDTYSYLPVRTAIEQTLGTARIAYANALFSRREEEIPGGFTTILAVNDSLSKQTRGILLAEYDMDEFVEQTLRFELPYLNIAISEERDSLHPLYSQKDVEVYSRGNTEQVVLRAGDLTWLLRMHPREQYVMYPHAMEAYFIFMLGVATSILLIVVLRQRDDYSERLDSEVTQRTSELEESNRLKENLLREIHHRVKNNLQIASSLMNMQKRKVMSPEAVEALNDSQNRILAIALTHQKIYQDKDTKAVNLKEYLNDLVSNQKKFFPHVKYIISSPEILIDLDKAVPLALITSELVTNAAKHAFPENISDPRLEILVTQETEDRVTILLKDNGVGLNQLFDIKKSDGLGFKIIQALCKQINATFWHRNDNGATFELEFENKL
jgi:two-component sensor histidine kinase